MVGTVARWRLQDFKCVRNYFNVDFMIGRNKYQLRHDMTAAAKTLVLRREIGVIRVPGCLGDCCRSGLVGITPFRCCKHQRDSLEFLNADSRFKQIGRRNQEQHHDHCQANHRTPLGYHVVSLPSTYAFKVSDSSREPVMTQPISFSADWRAGAEG